MYSFEDQGTSFSFRFKSTTSSFSMVLHTGFIVTDQQRCDVIQFTLRFLHLHHTVIGSLRSVITIGWVFWPVKPTTESENGLQLDSLSSSVNINHLTMVDNTSAVGNNSRPWVVSQSINGCQLSWGRDGSLQIQSLVEFLISSGHLCPLI